MTTNLTTITPNIIIGIYIVVTIYILSTIISAIICLVIVYLTYVTTMLHTPTNLLVSNTCLCTLVFSGVSTVNTIFFFMQSISTDWSCRIRGYLTYVSICLVSYSLAIQAISRLFWVVLYKYRYLLTMKCHCYLIFIQISFSFLFPLSSIITTNIIFRPLKLCVVPIQYKIHCMYLVSIVYCIPILIIIILYIIIYCNTKNSSLNTRGLLHGTKRDRKLARNILILISIFLFGGIPICIYIILSNKIESLPTNFYLFTIATPAIAIIFEKITIVILNEEIRKVINQRWIARQPIRLPSNRVVPISSSKTTKKTTIGTISKSIPTPIAWQ